MSAWEIVLCAYVALCVAEVLVVVAGVARETKR